MYELIRSYAKYGVFQSGHIRLKLCSHNGTGSTVNEVRNIEITHLSRFQCSCLHETEKHYQDPGANYIQNIHGQKHALLFNSLVSNEHNSIARHNVRHFLIIV